MNPDLIIDSVRQYFGSKHYAHSGAFWGAIGTLACFVLMLTSVPGSQPHDPVQYEHVVLVGVGFSLLSLIGTLLRNTTLRGSLPTPVKQKPPRREKPERPFDLFQEKAPTPEPPGAPETTWPPAAVDEAPKPAALN